VMAAHLKHPHRQATLCNRSIEPGFQYANALIVENLWNVTCERCLRSIVKRVPEAKAQLDWLRSQRKED
jgi:hypothetical protein